MLFNLKENYTSCSYKQYLRLYLVNCSHLYLATTILVNYHLANCHLANCHIYFLQFLFLQTIILQTVISLFPFQCWAVQCSLIAHGANVD